MPAKPNVDPKSQGMPEIDDQASPPTAARASNVEKLESRQPAQADAPVGEEDRGAPPSETPRRPRRLLWILAALVALAIVVGGVVYWRATLGQISTDDAFIDARSSSVSAEVAGAITALPVVDNQLVKSGDVLARIDDRDYRAAVDQAKAAVDQAQAAIGTAEAQIPAQRALIDVAQKQLAQAQAALSFSTDQNTRAASLAKNGAGTVQQEQQANSDLLQKQAAVEAAQASLTQSKRQVAVLQAQAESARAQRASAQSSLELANANLSRATLTSPIEGRVTNLTAAVGNYATPGGALMVIVPLKVWVTANFKETDLQDVRVGQRAKVEIDAYGRSFSARVDSVQAGSGTAFSLLPAENATGNYVKVVQRVPVKIVFDAPPDVELGPGMSVVPTVFTR
jgi:membrane fusion protein (multidrug efflux system)